ncbi:porin, partial [Aureimonas sp. AU12]|uniref:porin n=1 Tax=Aureimonas sp. AU12 TaxID=1638161 RepID=UPI000A4EB996
KSLLLGSAAALVAVSGARAADAVVMAEPEPVDYVRVCDVYGKGFYYIPGTETCLSVGGYVRFQVNVAGDPIRNLEG